MSVPPNTSLPVVFLPGLPWRRDVLAARLLELGLDAVIASDLTNLSAFPKPPLVIAEGIACPGLLKAVGDRPDQVSGLILLAPVIRLQCDPLPEPWVRAVVHWCCVRRLGGRRPFRPWRRFQEKPDRFEGNPLTADRAGFDDLDDAAQTASYAGLKALFDLTADLKPDAVRTPLLALLPSADRISNFRAAGRFFARCSAAQTVEIWDARHGLVAESTKHQKALAALIQDFARTLA
ncbi:MAG: serine aminopeptidase domain-containing protein [Rhodospirillales bacterium]